MSTHLGPEAVDELLGRIEATLKTTDDCHASGRRVRLEQAQVNLTKLLEEARKIMHHCLKESRNHHELLQTTFGGDFVRISRLQVILEHMTNADKRYVGQEHVDACVRECNSVQRVLQDLGCDGELDQIQEEQLDELEKRRTKDISRQDTRTQISSPSQVEQDDSQVIDTTPDENNANNIVHQLETIRLDTTRLRSENQRLRSELRRALAQETIAGTMHLEFYEQEAPRTASGPQDADNIMSSEEYAALQHEAVLLRKLVEKRSAHVKAGTESKAVLSTGTSTKAVLSTGTSMPSLISSEVCETARSEGLLTEASFEMLSTLAEVELAEEKKILQQKVHTLQRQLRERTQLNLPVQTFHKSIGRKEQRKLQQLDAIAAALHWELQRRAASTLITPRTCLEKPCAQDEAQEVAYPCASERTCQSTAKQLSLPSQRSAASQLSRMELRMRQLDSQIKVLSRRFVLVRDMK